MPEQVTDLTRTRIQSETVSLSDGDATGHVTGGLLKITDDQTATGRGKRSLQMLDAEASEPNAVFHDQNANGRVGQHPAQLAPAAAQPRPDLGHHLHDHQPNTAPPLHNTRHLPAKD
jgi:hypothetical protein